MLQLLLVENDDQVAEVLKGGIESSCDIAVTWAKTGSTASHVLWTQEFDAAVIETVVPEISGFELARRAANGNVPVLLMSGHPEQQHLCREYGFPFVVKPFLPSALLVSLMAILHRTPQNIARVRQSCSRLTTTMVRSKLLALQATRLRDESRVVRSKTLTIRNRLHDALDAIQKPATGELIELDTIPRKQPPGRTFSAACHSADD